MEGFLADERACRVCADPLTKPSRGPWPTYCGVRCRRLIEYARRRVARQAEVITIWRPLATPDQLREMRSELARLKLLAEGDTRAK